MKIAVWDTYVQRENGAIMHFDILVASTITDQNTILEFGREYLKTKPFKCKAITAKKCNFCHIETASSTLISQVQLKGYDIIEIENCV